jgi:soluble lytic murein transglycosylase-like protein
VNRFLSSGLAGILLASSAAWSQPPANFEASVKAAMAQSIAEQRAAVKIQVATKAQSSLGQKSSPASSGSFFTAPFSTVEQPAFDCDPLPDDQLNPLIESASATSGVDAELMRAVIQQESAGRPCALSAQGAEGLMQLMPATAEEFNVDDPFDPKQNIEAGAKLLKTLLDRYQNDPSLALSAYNSGPERVDRDGALPAIPETMNYVAAILGKLLNSDDKSKPYSLTTQESGASIFPNVK